MIVCKFGGSSVADATQIKKIENIVKSNPDRKVVVVSAPGKRNKQDEKITDLLYKCQKVSAAGEDFIPVWNKIRSRYIEIAETLGVFAAIIDELNEVEKNFAAGCTPDYAASRGEYLNARLISSYFGFDFIDSADVVRLGAEGEILPETYTLIQARAAKGKKYVIPGFYGRGLDGKIKTFSRGGSDITGSIYAKAMNADIYENWTDVSGIYTADPRITENAKPIAEITYREMREMAYLGANVFHEEAIAPAKDADITINIKNTNKPEDAGTFVRSSRDSSVIKTVGTAGKCGFVRIIAGKADECKKNKFAALGITPAFVLDGIDNKTFFAQVPQEINLAEIEKTLNVECTPGLAIVGIIGDGLADSYIPVLQLLDSLKKHGINVFSFNYGGSASSAVFSVSESDYEAAIDIAAGQI